MMMISSFSIHLNNLLMILHTALLINNINVIWGTQWNGNEYLVKSNNGNCRTIGENVNSKYTEFTFRIIQASGPEARFTFISSRKMMNVSFLAVYERKSNASICTPCNAENILPVYGNILYVHRYLSLWECILTISNNPPSLNLYFKRFWIFAVMSITFEGSLQREKLW